MYCVFYKDHSSVYLQCATANDANNSTGAHADIQEVNYMLYWVVSIFIFTKT